MSIRNIDAMRVLAKAIRQLRDDKQDGYPNIENGKFVHGTSLRFEPEELDTLCEAAGIVPDAVMVNGDCSECVYGNARGGDLGWSNPCCSCARPKMMHFVSLDAVRDSALRINAKQAVFLDNIFHRRWWATGIATAKQFSKEWNEQIAWCRRTEDALVKRAFMCNGAISGKRLTNKGMRALRLFRSNAKVAS